MGDGEFGVSLSTIPSLRLPGPGRGRAALLARCPRGAGRGRAGGPPHDGDHALSAGGATGGVGAGAAGADRVSACRKPRSPAR